MSDQMPGNEPTSPDGGMGMPGPAGSKPSSEETNWALAAHLGPIVLSFLAPLIVMLTKGKESAFVKGQSVEALNFNITLAIAYAIAWVLTAVVIGLVMLPVLWIGSLVLMIQAAIKVSNGEEYRYPINWRIVK